MLCVVAPTSAHAPTIVRPDDVWRSWTFDPLVLLSIAAAGWIYGRGVRLLWGRPELRGGVSRLNVLAFAAGQAALIVALVSPLDALGGTLLSAHMAQHGLLAGVAPPLLLMGKPGVTLAWGVSGISAVRRLAPLWRSLGGLARMLSTPMRATVLHGLTMWFWHAPMLFGAAVEHEWVHALQHLSFVIPALLFWRALLDEQSTSHGAAAAVAAFVTFMHTGLLGGLITMAPEPLYPIYAGRTGSWELTALADQQLAGLFMWVPLGLPYVVAGLLLVSRLVRGRLEDAEREHPVIVRGAP
jgi:putative membrane protein